MGGLARSGPACRVPAAESFRAPLVGKSIQYQSAVRTAGAGSEVRDHRSSRGAADGDPLLGLRAEALAKAWETAG